MILNAKRRGYALLWAIVFTAVTAAILATAVPYLTQLNDVTRVQSAGAMLQKIQAGVLAFNTSVCRNGGCSSFNAPGRISELAIPVVNGDPTSCTGTTLNATSATNWSTKGPFVSFYIPLGGVQTPIGKVNDAPVDRAPNNSAAYVIQIPNVTTSDAAMLDLYIDGVANSAAGTVQYSAPVSGLTTVSWSFTLTNNGVC